MNTYVTTAKYSIIASGAILVAVGAYSFSKTRKINKEIEEGRKRIIEGRKRTTEILIDSFKILNDLSRPLANMDPEIAASIARADDIFAQWDEFNL